VPPALAGLAHVRAAFEQDPFLYNEGLAKEVTRYTGALGQPYLLVGLDGAGHPAVDHDVSAAQFALDRGLRPDEKRSFDLEIPPDGALNPEISVYLELALKPNTCLK